jgi:hypothetical protein
MIASRSLSPFERADPLLAGKDFIGRQQDVDDLTKLGAFEKVTQASPAFIVNVCIDQFDRNTLREEKGGFCISPQKGSIQLNELVANNCVPEAARKGLRGSLTFKEDALSDEDARESVIDL